MIQAGPGSSAADAAADADANDEGGYGGLGLGAAPGLGSTAGLGAGGGGLGLGFRKAGEPSTSAPVDPEVRTQQLDTCDLPSRHAFHSSRSSQLSAWFGQVFGCWSVTMLL